MSISLHPKKCCKVPSLANTTTLDAAFAAYATISGLADCSSTFDPATNIALFPRGDDGLFCDHTTIFDYNRCHLREWPDYFKRSVDQVFTANDPPSLVMNTCNGKGQKLAVAKKIWQGRFGFVDDYIAYPKIGLHFTQYDTDADFSESLSATTNYVVIDVSLMASEYSGSSESSYGNAGKAQSSRPDRKST